MVESHSGSRLEYMLKAKAQFKRRSTANNVEITVPVPDDADTPRFRTNIGSVYYAPEKSAIVWKIKQFAGGKEFLMRAELGLPSVREAEPERKKRPISVKFEIPYFTTSGIQVRYLKIIEPKVRNQPTYYAFSSCADSPYIAAIPIPSVGTIHHSKRGYYCSSTRCTILTKGGQLPYILFQCCL